jgi:hypothetical protein
MITSTDLELKGAKEDAIIENAEIVLYDMLLHLVEKMGITSGISVLFLQYNSESCFIKQFEVLTNYLSIDDPATSIDIARAAIMILIIAVYFETNCTNGYVLPECVYQKCAYCYLSFVLIQVIENVVINSNV